MGRRVVGTAKGAQMEKIIAMIVRIVAASKHRDAARAFIAFLSSAATRGVLAKLGFEAP